MDNLDDFAFHKLLELLALSKLDIRSRTGLANFMSARGHHTIQQSASRYLKGETRPSPAWVKDFMRFAGLDSKERRALFNAYVATDQERQALLHLRDFVEEGEDLDRR